ncbi:MAG TPA: discoidin domain-containing protein [Polyangiaceae bacterium]|nr:discoidin domain-containing protein [Polyangiaceae bacterium]
MQRKQRLGRFWRWFWLSDQLQSARNSIRITDSSFAQRARVAAEIARRSVETPDPLGEGKLAVICELYRESIHWSLLALAPPAEEPSASITSTAPWSAVDARVLAGATASEDELARVKSAVDTLSFHELGVLPPEAQAKLGDGLRRVALALLSELALPERVMEAFWVKRTLRLGLVAAAAAALLGALAWQRQAREHARDLAYNRPWHASSAFALAGGGCISPKQECADGPNFFFHTQEEREPWVEFDLGANQRFSTVNVVNRSDCCVERAAPLVLEVSSDHEKWKQIARRDKEFATWVAQFPPVEARWVRLRVLKQTFFHLAQVHILR